MNGVFLISMFIAFRLLMLFLDDKIKSLATVLIVFSCFYFLNYKDVPEPGQTGLAAWLLLLYSIAKYKKEGNKKLLYFSSVIAPLFGVGFPSIFLLLLWQFIEFLQILRERGRCSKIRHYNGRGNDNGSQVLPAGSQWREEGRSCCGSRGRPHNFTDYRFRPADAPQRDCNTRRGSSIEVEES